MAVRVVHSPHATGPLLAADPHEPRDPGCHCGSSRATHASRVEARLAAGPRGSSLGDPPLILLAPAKEEFLGQSKFEIWRIKPRQTPEGGQVVDVKRWRKDGFGRWCIMVCVRVVAPSESAAKAAIRYATPTADPNSASSQSPGEPDGTESPATYHVDVTSISGSGGWVVAEFCWDWCFYPEEVPAGGVVSFTVPSGIAGGSTATYRSPPRP
ncbi:MAG: hypothetical protein HMLKMBBP_02807 [Planctomycetes bacterium]|nr:hypothetical protein [Planctomycetota bacterium]